MSSGVDGLTGLRILVVEDEFVITLDIEEVLRRCGCEIIGPASTVTAALDAVQANDRLNGVLLDLNLNGESALPVAEALAERHVPFVVVTGNASREFDAQVLREAPRLSKPFNPDDLAAAVTENFSSRAS